MDSQDPFVGLGYLGSFDHALDNQGRVAIPSEWRNRSEETRFVLYPGASRDLLLYPPDAFGEFIRRARNEPFNAALQKALALFGSMARNCCCDKQGRIKIERNMLDLVGIDGQVKLIGAVTHIRVSAPENWVGGDPAAAGSFMEELHKICTSGGDFAGLLKNLANQ